MQKTLTKYEIEDLQTLSAAIANSKLALVTEFGESGQLERCYKNLPIYAELLTSPDPEVAALIDVSRIVPESLIEFAAEWADLEVLQYLVEFGYELQISAEHTLRVLNYAASDALNRLDLQMLEYLLFEPKTSSAFVTQRIHNTADKIVVDLSTATLPDDSEFDDLRVFLDAYQVYTKLELTHDAFTHLRESSTLLQALQAVDSLTVDEFEILRQSMLETSKSRKTSKSL